MCAIYYGMLWWICCVWDILSSWNCQGCCVNAQICHVATCCSTKVWASRLFYFGSRHEWVSLGRASLSIQRWRKSSKSGRITWLNQWTAAQLLTMMKHWLPQWIIWLRRSVVLATMTFFSEHRFVFTVTRFHFVSKEITNCLSNALHSSIGQNIKSLACQCPVSSVWSPMSGPSVKNFKWP